MMASETQFFNYNESIQANKEVKLYDTGILPIETLPSFVHYLLTINVRFKTDLHHFINSEFTLLKTNVCDCMDREIRCWYRWYLNDIQYSTYDVLLFTIFKQLNHNYSNKHELR
jgi:hypothetical protein